MRRTLEHLVTTGKTEWMCSRGRQRIKIFDGLAACQGKHTIAVQTLVMVKIEGDDLLHLQHTLQPMIATV